MELYIQNPAGYYDAVLMDIRMPLMDGLQATINIRHWSKEDAKTIPIIAMTANAFDEDVEKSRAAGMNAHLSKPIEPNNLYAVLERLIDKQE
jgi:CheY-like chemotaxis protein